jgi:cobalamin synthase
MAGDDEVDLCRESCRVTIGAPAEARVVLVWVVMYAAVASLARPLTVAAAFAVGVPAVVVVVLVLLGRRSAERGQGRPGVRRTAALWAVVVALAGVWELAAWQQQPAYNVASYEHPTASVLLDPITESWAPRFAAWCCWLYVGYRLVRR